MGMGSALKLKQVLTNVEHILAIELLCGAQGVDFHRPLRPGKGTRRAVKVIRKIVPPLGQDRVLAPDIDQVRRLISAGAFSRVLSEARKG